MKVTNGKIKDKQLHIEGHLQIAAVEKQEFAEASACQRIAENTDIITDKYPDAKKHHFRKI